MRGFSTAAVIALTLFAPSPAFARDIHDDFETRPLDADWYACRRPENNLPGNFKIDHEAFSGRPALKLGVRPVAPLVALLAPRNSHDECDPADTSRDKYDRAEIWEQPCDYMPFGTEVWQQFSMKIQDVPQSWWWPRLVVGQWKEGEANKISGCAAVRTAELDADEAPAEPESTWGPSPFLAQRFGRHAFAITIEQDDLTREERSEEDQCRIVLAVDQPALQGTLAIMAHNASPYDRTIFADMVRGNNKEHFVSSEHGLVEASCMRHLKIERFAVLPSPFDHWRTMKYHFKANADAGATPEKGGVVEVWADNKLIARATGRIGAMPPSVFSGYLKAFQYYKFGPYRNREKLPFNSWIANYSKASREQDLR